MGEVVRVRDDKRLNPRIDFHLNVLLRGLKGVKRVKNLSRGGVFVELEETGRFRAGEEVELVTRLPLEKRIMIVKGRVTHATGKGIGIEFLDLWGPNSQAIERTFQVFKATIPMPEG